MENAYGYIRVSSIGQNSGGGFDRQENAIFSHAFTNKLNIKKIYKETASGTIKNRKELTRMLIELEENNINIVIIERIDRLARDLMIQESIIDNMRKNNIKLISVADGDLLVDDPTRIVVRQVLGAFAQYDKTMIVQKLKLSRERLRAKNGKCEGRKSYSETNPALLDEINRLRRKPRKRKRLSNKEIVKSLNQSGFKTATGKEFTTTILKNIIY